MDDLHDYAECVKIEKARCEFRDRCSANFDLQSCIAYYREFCRTREIEQDYEDIDINNCINDINSLGTPQQCKRLKILNGKSEICRFKELASCQKFLCEKNNDTGADSSTQTSGGDTETQTSTTSGLNPAP
jgi:hypothetical protein